MDSLKQAAFHRRPLNPGSKYVQAAIVLDMVNNGRSVEHNVTCEVRFEEQDAIPDDMHGVSRDYFALRMGPSSTGVHSVNVGILSYGPTKAHYRCVCDEVGETEGVIEFDVPERDHQ